MDTITAIQLLRERLAIMLEEGVYMAAHAEYIEECVKEIELNVFSDY